MGVVELYISGIQKPVKVIKNVSSITIMSDYIQIYVKDGDSFHVINSTLDYIFYEDGFLAETDKVK